MPAERVITTRVIYTTTATTGQTFPGTFYPRAGLPEPNDEKQGTETTKLWYPRGAHVFRVSWRLLLTAAQRAASAANLVSMFDQLHGLSLYLRGDETYFGPASLGALRGHGPRLVLDNVGAAASSDLLTGAHDNLVEDPDFTIRPEEVMTTGLVADSRGANLVMNIEALIYARLAAN